MRIFRRARAVSPDDGPRVADTAGVHGHACVGKRTKDLTSRIAVGDIVVIDHEDLDVVAAESVAARRPAAVLNAAASVSGRYPNRGPLVLVEAGIPLLDRLGSDIMAIADGERVHVDGPEVRVGGTVVATGQVQGVASLEEAMEASRENLADQIEAFAENTMSYMIREKDLLIDGVGVPEIRTDFGGREALVVVRGHQYREDLATLRPYIRENRPITVGVDGGADAILAAGYGLDLIIGDMDSVSETALRSGAELVVHAYPDGRAPAMERLAALGLADRAVRFPAGGTSEDIAMLLADDRGAELIVAVGTHATLVEFLDKGRAGMSSTFLTRLRVGTKLVDAKGVSRLYRQRVSNAQVGLLGLSGLAAVGAALWSTAAGQTFYLLIGAGIDRFVGGFMRLFTG